MRYCSLRFLCGFLLFCDVGQADIDCDGLDDVLTTNLALSVFHSSTVATAMLWVRVGSGGSGGTFCWDAPPYLADDTLSWVLAQQPAGTVCGFVDDGTAGQRVESPATAGTWVHLASTLTGGLFSFYKDGTLVGTAGIGPIGAMTGVLRLCGHVGEVKYVQARVTEVAVYPVAVPAGEIATLGRSRQRGRGRSAPTGYWPLTQCPDGQGLDGAGFLDRAGFGRTMTADNGANNTGMTCRASALLRHPWGPH